MSKEFKKYGLTHTRRPAKSELLLTTVAIQKEDGSRWYCYVSFSPALVQAVGKKLPEGVRKDHPAMLFVRQVEQGWEVWARYVEGDVGRKLWTSSATPEWLRFYKVRKQECQ